MARIADKDKGAFEELYRAYYHRVFQFAHRMVRDRGTVEEVVDDTLFAVWRGAASFQGKSAVSTWILGIAYRRALKALESGRRHHGVELNLDAVNERCDPHPDANPASVAIAADMRRLLNANVARLSDDHRAVVLLTVMGYSYTEIADVMDCPANTVKTRMFYARKNLQKWLAEPARDALTNPGKRQLWTHDTPVI